MGGTDLPVGQVNVVGEAATAGNGCTGINAAHHLLQLPRLAQHQLRSAHCSHILRRGRVARCEPVATAPNKQCQAALQGMVACKVRDLRGAVSIGTAKVKVGAGVPRGSQGGAAHSANAHEKALQVLQHRA